MSDQTELDRAESLEGDRVRRANQLAYAQGRREADVDRTLQSHENRLNAINGSIERHAKNAAALGRSIDGVRDMVEDIATTLATQAAIEADRVKQVKQANEKQISNRTFWLGVITIAVMIAGLIVTVLVGTHAV